MEPLSNAKIPLGQYFIEELCLGVLELLSIFPARAKARRPRQGLPDILWA